jgi:DNA-binding NarL/FixJ family response regulator
MPSKQIIIGIADDMLLDQKLIEHQTRLLKQTRVLFKCGNGRELLFKLQQYNPDILIIDLYMPIMSGWEVLPYLKETYKGNIICTSASIEPSYLKELRDFGVKGFAYKQGNQLSTAIQKVSQGEIFFETTPGQQATSTNQSADIPIDGREIVMLNKLAEGKNSKTISEELGGLSEGTIDTYIKKLMVRCDCHNRTQLVAWAFAHGLIHTFDNIEKLPIPKTQMG